MTLETNSLLGHGGTGQGRGPRSMANMVRELQALQVSVVTGGAANARLTVPNMQSDDTLISVLNFTGGVPTDVTATAKISENAASGTITCGTAVVGDTVTVGSQTYTLVGPLVATVPGSGKFKAGATPALTAAALASAINAYNDNISSTVKASVLGAVVTVKAVLDGTAANATPLTEVGTTFTVSGATFTGGSATGAIQVSVATTALVVYWFMKP